MTEPADFEGITTTWAARRLDVDLDAIQHVWYYTDLDDGERVAWAGFEIFYRAQTGYRHQFVTMTEPADFARVVTELIEIGREP